MTLPKILQFGTSRFLQAHVDLFVSESLKDPDQRPITVVQSTGHAGRAKRLAALAAPQGFPVHIRGYEKGAEVEQNIQVTSIGAAFSMAEYLPQVMAAFTHKADIVISNTSEAGWVPQAVDSNTLYDPAMSFPAKLVQLLLVRHAAGGRSIQIMPTELVPQNGDRLRELVLALASPLSTDLAHWIESEVTFVNSLVDRIVSTPLEPAGAVAEPYALWAIEKGPNVQMPWEHPSIVMTNSLQTYQSLKLFILNLGHTFLVSQWQKGVYKRAAFVRQLMQQKAAVSDLQDVFDQEVMPGFAAAGLESEARAYFATTLDRFRNPYLDHRLSDIAEGHAEKLKQRVGGFMTWARDNGANHDMPRLESLA